MLTFFQVFMMRFLFVESCRSNRPSYLYGRTSQKVSAKTPVPRRTKQRIRGSPSARSGQAKLPPRPDQPWSGGCYPFGVPFHLGNCKGFWLKRKALPGAQRRPELVPLVLLRFPLPLLDTGGTPQVF